MTGKRHGPTYPLRAGVLLATAALLAGCLIIPTDYKESGSRGNVTAETAAKLRPGTTSKEDILLQLGEPDWKSPDERQIGYAWSKVKALFIFGAYYTGGVAEISKDSELRLTFNENDTLVSADVVSHWNQPGQN